jgi:hypothetical protein
MLGRAVSIEPHLPVTVSQKREYFKELLETDDSVSETAKLRVWRPLTELREPGIGGLFGAKILR